MGSSAPNQVRVGVGVFVVREHDDPRFLLGERKGSLGAGTLALPGGHLEVGESLEACAAREVLEETGLRLGQDAVEFLTAVDSVFRDAASGEVEKHYVTVFMRAVVPEGQGEPKTMEPDKCTGWRWTTFEEMRRAEEEKVFLPLVRLMQLRPGVCQLLQGREEAADEP